MAVHFRHDFIMEANTRNINKTALCKQSDFGTYRLQYRIPKTISRRDEQTPITTKFVCFSRLKKCFASMANSVEPDQTAPIGAVCSGSTLFASILNSSVMLGNYL